MQKYIRKTEPYRYQWKDNQDRTLEVRDSKPPTGEIKTISRELKTLKSLKKAQGREINSVHSRVPPMKMPKNDELVLSSLKETVMATNYPMTICW